MTSADSVVLPFQSPCSILIVGSTKSGKTMLTFRIIKQCGAMFSVPPVKIVYCYSVYQELFDTMEREIKNITFHEGLPNSEQVDMWSEKKEPMLLILDDLMASAVNNAEVLNLFTIKCHHANINVIMLTQNLYHSPGKYMRTISLNSSYIIVLKNKRDSLQINTLGKQILPGQVKYFMSAYEKATEQKDGYLLIDLCPHTDKTYLLRTNIFKGEDCVVFLPK